MNSIKPALDELERAFHALSPPLPLITFQHPGRKNSLGWFSTNQGDKLCAFSLKCQEIPEKPDQDEEMAM